MKRLLLFLVLFLIPEGAQAQNAHIQDVYLGSVSQSTSLGQITYAQPLAGAVITVCLATGSGMPCSPIAPICLNETDTTCNQPNPTATDVNGNLSVWVPAGQTYVVTAQAANFTARTTVYTVPIDPNGPVTFLSNVTVNGTLASPNIVLTGAPAGRCVQTTTGGALTYISGACGTSSGTLTATGSPIANQGAYWTSPTSLTGSSNWSVFNGGNAEIWVQPANGNNIWRAYRFTDGAPTGNFLIGTNAVGGQALFLIDVLGSIEGGQFANINSTNLPGTGTFKCSYTETCLTIRNSTNTGDVLFGLNGGSFLSLNKSSVWYTIPVINGAVSVNHLATWNDTVGTLQDGGLPVSLVISGTTTLTAGTVTAPTCQAVVTSTASGVLSSDTIEWSYASAPTTQDGLVIVSAYATSNGVNFLRCNASGQGETVSALVINWRVYR